MQKIRYNKIWKPFIENTQLKSVTNWMNIRATKALASMNTLKIWKEL